MKKAYLITYFHTGTKSHLKQVVEVIDSIGKKNAIQQTAKSYTAILVPTDENVDASVIRKKISEKLNPFDENVSVARMVASDYSETDGIGCGKIVEACACEDGREPRNFSRFNSKQEAYLAYQREKPRWVYQNGMGGVMAVDFNEWVWLPIRKNGIYERNGKYDKYINK